MRMIVVYLLITGCSTFAIRKEWGKEIYPKYYKLKKCDCLYKIKNVRLYSCYLKKPTTVHSDGKDLIFILDRRINSVFLRPIEEKIVIDSFVYQVKMNRVAFNVSDSMRIADVIKNITIYNKSKRVAF